MNKTFILMFDLCAFNPDVLSLMGDEELFHHAKAWDKVEMSDGKNFAIIYEVREFCEACNNSEIAPQDWWLYTVTIKI